MKEDESEVEFSLPVQIAWKTLQLYVRSGKIPDTMDVPDFQAGRAGCFVSLKKHGELRGCIGTIAPVTERIESEIIRNAIAACSEDPRFDPVKPDELADLTVSVDILGSPEPVSSKSELNPAVYGVIVTSGYRRGLLLPDLEGVDTVEYQLAIACRKAGISPDEPYRIERFQVTRYY